MNNIIDVYKSVAAWNAARYEQQLNLELAVSLLREEYKEWKDAKVAVEKLDALCDISYVALGIVWKSGISETLLSEKLTSMQMAALLHLDAVPGMRPIYNMAAYIDGLEHDFEFGIIDSIALILHSCAFQAMYDYQLTPEQWISALEAVCVSNDSKVVVQVDASVKANAGNKGPSYVSPTAALTKILNVAFMARGMN